MGYKQFFCFVVKNIRLRYLFGKFQITQLFCQKFKITHTKAHFVKKLRDVALPQVQTP